MDAPKTTSAIASRAPRVLLICVSFIQPGSVFTQNEEACGSRPLPQPQPVATCVPTRYVLLKLFRAFVTVNVPSCCALTLNQYDFPLCTGAGGACWPCGGGVQAATGIAAGCSS